MALFKLPLALLTLVPFAAVSDGLMYAQEYRDQGALFCEGGSIYTQRAPGNLVACWKLGYGCTYSRELLDYTYPGNHWLGFNKMVGYHLYCTKTGGRVGLCYKNGGSYTWTDSCGTSKDGTAVIVKTRISRRNLRGNDTGDVDTNNEPEDDLEFEGPTKIVEIDGETVEMVNPDDDDYDYDEYGDPVIYGETVEMMNLDDDDE